MNPTQPDPAFVEHLEWQVRTALRRRDRFARPTAAPLARVARTAALCMLCVVVGAGAVVGAEQLQQDRERTLHVTRARLEVEMAELRLARATAELARLEAAFANAVVSSATVEGARTRSARLARDAERERLELAETEASGRPANDDLAAPRVDGRDFVSERLQLDLAAREEQRDHLADAAERSLLLHENGMITAGELQRERAALAAADGRIQLLLDLLALRKQFLAGTLDAGELLVREQIAILGAEVREFERELLGLDEALAYTRQLAERGFVPRSEVEEAEHARELRARELELLRLERQQWIERSTR